MKTKKAYIKIDRGTFERVLLLIWFLYFLLVINPILINVEFLLASIVLPLFIRYTDVNFLKNPLLIYGVIAVFNIPFVWYFRKIGVSKLHFLVHQEELNKTGYEEGDLLFYKVEEFIKSLEDAVPEDRPKLRAEVKKYILDKKDEFDQDTIDYILEKLGYMFPSSTFENTKNKKLSIF